eukprot:3936385-Pyramimonas_sp.AAC.1
MSSSAIFSSHIVGVVGGVTWPKGALVHKAKVASSARPHGVYHIENLARSARGRKIVRPSVCTKRSTRVRVAANAFGGGVPTSRGVNHIPE